MANDELRRVPPDIVDKVGCRGNLGGNAGVVLVPVWDEGFFYLPLGMENLTSQILIYLISFRGLGWVYYSNCKCNNCIFLINKNLEGIYENFSE